MSVLNNLNSKIVSKDLRCETDQNILVYSQFKGIKYIHMNKSERQYTFKEIKRHQ